METIGVRELRQNASAHLRRVQGGEAICVTDRGQPVAILMPTGDAVRQSVSELLLGLVRAGAYPDLDGALAAGIGDLVHRARRALVDEAVAKGYGLHPQELDPWVEEASFRVLADLEQ